MNHQAFLSKEMNWDDASTKDHPRSAEPMTTQREKGIE
jgi:hypothetical protein